MLARSVTIGLVCLVAFGATHAVADTSDVIDPRPSAGLHDIRRLVVDNTGDRVGVTAVHAGTRWRGTVHLAFDVAGGPAVDFVALLDHARPLQSRFMRPGGSPWRCAGRSFVSRPASRTSVVSAPRGCLNRAPKMRIRATVRTIGSKTQTLASKVVLQQSRPNIVVIMTDDMRADDLRFMPSTRRLIADKGVSFRNGFSTYPLCCPARASVLSGQYTHNHRVFSINRPWGFTSFDDSSTLATWLRGSGYATVYLGKYLNGYGWMPEPGAESGKSLHYVPPGWDDWRASIDSGLGPEHPEAGGTYRYFDTTLSHNGVGFDSYRGQYQTHVYGHLSEQIIRSRAASDRPFFLYASYTAPHTNGRQDEGGPRVPRDDGLETAFGAVARPDEVKGMFNDRITAAPGASWSQPDMSAKPAYLRSLPAVNDAERLAMRDLTRERAEALHVVDQQVKRTIDALAASGELEETLVMFTSDNGYFLGEQRVRKGKTLPHEPSIRVPMLLRGPGIPAGQRRLDPFMLIDVAPTLARVADVQPTLPMDGVSMLSVARNGDRGWKRAVLTETGPRAVIRDTDESGLPVDADDPGARDQRWAIGVRTARYLYVDLATGEEELYDMATDPNQYHNLATAPGHADTLTLMRAQLQRYRACDAAACARPLPSGLAAAPR
jgi:N-acetylglucosamine-6-sulfatase